MRGDYWEIFDIDDTFDPGEEAVGEARRRARQFEATWAKTYPGAVATVTDGLDELIAHLHYRGSSQLGFGWCVCLSSAALGLPAAVLVLRWGRSR